MKAPVWTWEVPAYFFVGGVAGIAAVIALVASFLDGVGGTDSTITAARLVAVGGALLSPPLLISDLGRPTRFLYMLRVFKPTSAMSVGAWTLVVFSGATLAGAALWWLGPAEGVGARALLAFDLVAAATGIVLATYTGVLLGATVIPVWARRHRLLPFEFGISSLGAAASLVELLGGFTDPLHRAAIAAAALKTTLWLVGRARTQQPAADGHAGNLLTISTWLCGPIPLALRAVGTLWLPARVGGAACAIVGSLLLRFGWLSAGRDPVAADERV